MVTAQPAAIQLGEIGPWRLRLGMFLFALVLPPYALITPLVLSHLSLSTIATVTTGAVIAQKLLMVATVAVLGKPGFLYFRSKLFQRVKRLAPARAVGTVRHRIGLIMFCIPFIQDWIEAYASHFAPALVTNPLWFDVGSDLLLVASLFVLGGNFWDKLHALFIREATACFPQMRSRQGGDVEGRR